MHGILGITYLHERPCEWQCIHHLNKICVIPVEGSQKLALDLDQNLWTQIGSQNPICMKSSTFNINPVHPGQNTCFHRSYLSLRIASKQNFQDGNPIWAIYSYSAGCTPLTLVRPIVPGKLPLSPTLPPTLSCFPPVHIWLGDKRVTSNSSKCEVSCVQPGFGEPTLVESLCKTGWLVKIKLWIIMSFTFCGPCAVGHNWQDHSILVQNLYFSLNHHFINLVTNNPIISKKSS